MFSPVDEVDPNIGTIGHLLTATSPTVSLPHGMMKTAPVTTPGIADRYLADRIFGFPAGCVRLMPAGNPDGLDPSAHSSLYDHDLEQAAPYGYKVLLEDDDTAAEVTVSCQSAHFRFVYPADAEPTLLVSADKDGTLTAAGNGALGVSATLNGVPHFAHLEFSVLPEHADEWRDERRRGIAHRFAGGVRSIEIRVGISHISAAQARRNMERELAGRSFEQTLQAAKDEWNRALGQIAVEGGTEEERTVFYTSLYRSLLNMSLISEDGRYYSSYDHAVHEDDGRPFYVNDNVWDTYRCLHPLQLLLDPERKQDMIVSYLRMYEQCGWLPQFPYVQGDLPVMIGNHTAAMIWDAYRKGCRGFDLAQAYQAAKTNAMEVTMLPWVHGPQTELDRVYADRGFFPALRPGEREWVAEVHGFERRQAVSVTLEHAYDDWCLAEMAKELGYEDDYLLFARRSQNYRNVFDARIGFMAPKSADGEWVENFDPKYGGGLGGRDYFSECNAWIYTFHVQHDIAGLTELLGGPEALEKRLDALFDEQYDGAKYKFLGQFPDATGLIGQYCQGNEPAFHIPYLYNYTGSPWKTQRRVRELMKLWYRASPTGLCGDEDNGAMSSWYVFSAIGLYPVCPGKDIYEIGSPIFRRTAIDLPGGKPFVIVAEGVSARNKYVQSARLNGRDWQEPRIRHQDLVNGGELHLVMGDRPNKKWGAATERG
jgi:predicted alpha-1,2-mannosidase